MPIGIILLPVQRLLPDPVFLWLDVEFRKFAEVDFQ